MKKDVERRKNMIKYEKIILIILYFAIYTHNGLCYHVGKLPVAEGFFRPCWQETINGAKEDADNYRKSH